MASDLSLSRALLYRGVGVTVVELSRTGPPEHDGPNERAAQAVEYATVLAARTGCASLAHAGRRRTRRVIAEPGYPVVLHPGDTYRVHYPSPGTFRATVVVFASDPAPARAVSLPRTAGEAHRDLADRACALLAADPASAHRLRDLARALGVSPFHLARIFRAEIGMSLHQYLLRIRLGIAMEQLVAGERNLSRLALSVGFASHSHFSAAFRHTFGSSPRAMRAALAGAEAPRGSS